ncbi:FAD-containing oxidoreductase [Streptococcus sp. zg-JUN1979]|uniref:FAD-containing oxidoreductase n=1 Tax=Streptococcus sp. zg-JUN1979 TaxID=3391450 RepID=UPI0039A4DD2D
MVKEYDMIVVGFGKAGKTLAGKMSALGKKVALVEEDSSMYGGTCINIGCIPTKTMIVAAEEDLSFAQVMAQKEAVTSRLRGKNEAVLKGAGVDLYNAKARFVANKRLEITSGEDKEQLSADIIIINTGAKSNVLPIEGLLETRHVVDSTGIQQLKEQPKRLGIIGGGNIGLEFASLYAKLGSQVTVFEAGERLLPREEPVVAQMAKTYMEEDGITFKMGARISRLSNEGEEVVLRADDQDYHFDVVMYATGRKPNTDDLGLETTDIELNDRGAIVVDEYCQTSVKDVYAVGDVNGGLQFTYTSLDDFRIVYGKLTATGDYNLNKRQNVPTTTFIEPALSSVGLKEADIIKAGIPYQSKELLVAAMPRGHVNDDLRGLYKVHVNPETKEILGATLFAKNSEENINMIKMAMDNHIPYTYLKNQIFTHPTMAENLNDVFAID